MDYDLKRNLVGQDIREKIENQGLSIVESDPKHEESMLFPCIWINEELIST